MDLCFMLEENYLPLYSWMDKAGIRLDGGEGGGG